MQNLFFGFGFSTNYSQCKGAAPLFERQFGGAGYVAGLRSIGKLQLGPESGKRLGHRPFKLKVAEVAVHAAARANALHNLLAKVAALVEVERPQLRGFLGQVSLHNVDAVGGNALSDAE